MMHKAWSSIEEVPYCFSRSSVKFQGHIALKIVEFDSNWAFLDCNSSLNTPMAMTCCTKLETAKKRCPIAFQFHPSNFKVTRDKTSPNLTQIGRFRTIGRSQLSNPSDLPCFNLSGKIPVHRDWFIIMLKGQAIVFPICFSIFEEMPSYPALDFGFNWLMAFAMTPGFVYGNWNDNRLGAGNYERKGELLEQLMELARFGPTLAEYSLNLSAIVLSPVWHPSLSIRYSGNSPLPLYLFKIFFKVSHVFLISFLCFVNS